MNLWKCKSYVLSAVMALSCGGSSYSSPTRLERPEGGVHDSYTSNRGMEKLFTPDAGRTSADAGMPPDGSIDSRIDAMSSPYDSSGDSLTRAQDAYPSTDLPPDLALLPDEELPYDGGTDGIIPDENLLVAFIGDSGYGSNFRAVLELIREEGAEMVLHQGDLGYDDENPASPRLWLEDIEIVLDPAAPGGTFPYFFTLGDQDITQWEAEGGYRDILEQRLNALGLDYNGTREELGTKTSFNYRGIFITLTAPGYGSVASFVGRDHAEFLREELGLSHHLWELCSWHQNMNAMQLDGHEDETGWEVYETCCEYGGLIITGNDHRYARTHLLSDISEQTLADSTTPYLLEPGQTIVMITGTGGRPLNETLGRCRGWSAGGEICPEWASISGEQHGALFIRFHVDADPQKARGYFKTIDREVLDEFTLEKY